MNKTVNIICLTVLGLGVVGLEIVAISKGMNGTVLASTMAIVAFIAGILGGHKMKKIPWIKMAVPLVFAFHVGGCQKVNVDTKCLAGAALTCAAEIAKCIEAKESKETEK